MFFIKEYNKRSRNNKIEKCNHRGLVNLKDTQIPPFITNFKQKEVADKLISISWINYLIWKVCWDVTLETILSSQTYMSQDNHLNLYVKN